MLKRVGLFVPCFIDQFFPQTAVNMLRLLRRLGWEVLYNPQQTCCGQPACNAGFVGEGAAVGSKWLRDALDMGEGLEWLSPSASCAGFLAKDLGAHLPLGEQKALSAIKIWEYSQFFVEKVGIEALKSVLTKPLTMRVGYHDACAALRGMGIEEQPRALLRSVEGLEMVELADAAVCCGFGGSFAAKMEPISASMAQQKIQSMQAAGIEHLVSTDWSCLMQLQSYARAAKLPSLRFWHIADVLAAAMGVPA